MDQTQILALQQERQDILGKLTQFKDISVKDKNDLPDSSFAVILPGGKKDDSGKTVPRSLRKLPYKTMDGKLDAAHVKNAWAVLNGARGGANLGEHKEEAMKKIKAAMKELGVGEESMSAQAQPKELTQFAKVYDGQEVKVQNMNETAAVGDILALNEKLIVTLEQADAQIEQAQSQVTAVTQINEKLLLDLKEREAAIENYKQKETAREQAKFESRLNQVTQKWCEVFSLTDMNKQQDARKMLSTFQSEDKLAEIETFLAHKMSVMSNQPKPMTKQSDELALQQESKPQMPTKLVHEMAPDERKAYTDMLFNKLKQIK